MKKIVVALGLIGLPFLALADEMQTIDQQLNGLDIKVEMAGNSADPGPGVTQPEGPEPIRVTNNSDQTVACQLSPQPSEPAMEPSPEVSIKPSESATLRYSGKYTGMAPKMTLTCNPDQ